MSTGLAHGAEITERTTYFMVKGATFAEIDRALGVSGPLLSGGERHSGATKVSFRRNLEFAEKKGGCGVSRTNLRLDLVTTLPQWNAPRGADPKTRTMWKVLQRYIAEHEAHHSKIAKSWLERMNLELLGLPPERSCAQMEVVATRRARELLLGHEKAQREFDRSEARVVDAQLESKLAAATRQAAR